MTNDTTEVVRHLKEYADADRNQRWVWQELLIHKDVPSLIALVTRLEDRITDLETANENLKAEVQHLTQVAQRGGW